jgi:hypothetical protein
MRSRTRIVTIAGLLCSLTCVAILHIVRTDLPPASHRLSEYANGPHGWMMTMAFAALGCGLMALGVTLRTGRGQGLIARVIPAIAFLAAVGTVLSGIFRTGISDTSEEIHSRASALAVVAVVFLALAHSMPTARSRTGAVHDPLGAGLALTAAALAAISPLLHETRWTGLSQRLLWIALITWLLRTAWHVTPLAMSDRGSGRPVASHRSNDSQQEHAPDEQTSVPQDLE